ncbi:hypothetical protein SAMN05660706_10214 [Desulfoscipio geothermicus DSM 3669]|uniref:Uncharacterized protein n=1 Tax=Desulfoscipio geothermicus DSM 3669 TaxID=1121426 RepID=A0A1I6CTK0_9FIRM|nr:hypothetical protein SAMN05660706_10214 [Desulfoscipio geothermicus DSM 3669]
MSLHLKQYVSTVKAEPTQKFDVDLARTFRTTSLIHAKKSMSAHKAPLIR